MCFSVLEDADAYELMCRVMDEQSGRMVEAFENLMVLTESILRILFVAIAVAALNHWCGLFVLLAFLMILPVAKRTVARAGRPTKMQANTIKFLDICERFFPLAIMWASERSMLTRPRYRRLGTTHRSRHGCGKNRLLRKTLPAANF